MSTNETAIIVAGIGATLQLFRLSIDLIATASSKDAKADDKLEKATPAQLREQMRSKNLRRSTFFSFKGMSSMNQNLAQSEEGNGNSTTPNQSSLHMVDESSETETSREAEQSTVQKYLTLISTALNLSLLVYFLVICIVTSTAGDSNNTLYGRIPAGCAAAAMIFSSAVCLRDYERKRFTLIQRILHIMSSLILALGVIFCIAFAEGAISALDIASVTVLVIYALFVLIECKFINWPSSVTSDKKARLSMKSILLVLKPYFWPDATANSATLNRIRAMATWVFITASKLCSLAAPIYIGRASTDLTQGNYESCILNVIWYSLFTFASYAFKEGQTLVYLRVAQAAFVQLAELSFRHLHTLSLDWHLKKKLGEVIRSMDRGILACDTLIKYVFLWLLPAVAECILVTIIFATYFNYLPLAASVFFFVFVYMVMTVLLTLWRKKFRKQVAKSDNDWHDRATDSLINFETVKYFTAEDFEMKKFGEAVEAFQSGSVNVAASLSTLNLTQRLLLQACLAVSLILTTIAIRNRVNCCVDNGCVESDTECCSNLKDVCPGMEIGDFVAVLTYTINLFTPLFFLGSVYNAIVMAIVDLTNLSEILAENPDVSDAPDAGELPDSDKLDSETAVEFDNVRFHYPSQPETSGLKGVSFKMKKGTITAVGKCLRLRLLQMNLSSNAVCRS